MSGRTDQRDDPIGQIIGLRSGAPDDSSAALRRRAEERFRTQEGAPGSGACPQESARVLHELRVHQIELELQNEELRRTRAALEASRARYFDLFDLAPVGYLALSEWGMIRQANLAVATLLGEPRSALIERLLSDFVFAEDQDALYHCRRRLFATGERQGCELRLRRADGTTVWAALEANLGSLDDCVDEDADQSGPMRWRVILSDIGERKRAEERRQGRLISMLGHELRNPLAPIGSVAECLRRADTLELAQRRSLGDILARQLAHLRRLVDDALDLDSLRRGTIPLIRGPCDLRAALDCAAEQARPLLEQRGQRLDLGLPGTPAMVDGDPVRLAQAIVNLLRNASQFSPPGSPVSLTLALMADRAAVRVQDRGDGIDPRVLPRLFEPFVQARQPGAGAGGNLGIGLALVKDIVVLHGGRVEAQSPGPGKGSTFVLYLPLLPADAVGAPGGRS